jgi:hypothetical protein
VDARRRSGGASGTGTLIVGVGDEAAATQASGRAEGAHADPCRADQPVGTSSSAPPADDGEQGGRSVECDPRALVVGGADELALAASLPVHATW